MSQPRRVRVRVLEVDGAVELQVEDNGPGIPLDQHGKLFGRVAIGARCQIRHLNSNVRRHLIVPPDSISEQVIQLHDRFGLIGRQPPGRDGTDTPKRGAIRRFRHRCATVLAENQSRGVEIARKGLVNAF